MWGTDYPGDVRTVDVHIRRLREKIELSPSEPRYVHTKLGSRVLILMINSAMDRMRDCLQAKQDFYEGSKQT